MTRAIVALPLIALLYLPRTVESSTIHVSKTGSGADGSTWAEAFSSIGEALTVSASGDEIWVASGTYNETIDLVTGVAVYGGFAGTESADEFDRRDWVANETVLDATGLGDSAVWGANDSTLRGLVIANSSTQTYGGGIHCDGVTMEVSDCRFYRNSSRSPGPNSPLKKSLNQLRSS